MNATDTTYRVRITAGKHVGKFLDMAGMIHDLPVPMTETSAVEVVRAVRTCGAIDTPPVIAEENK